MFVRHGRTLPPRPSSVLLTCLCLFLALAASASEIVLAQGSAPGHVVLNEVLYDPPEGGSEGAREWVELLNTGASAASLAGWQIADNRASDPLPDIEIPAGGYLIVAGGEGFAIDHPGFGGRVVTLAGTIGNGLGNGGDQLRLLAADGSVVDGLSWGDDASQLAPPAPDVAAGHSLERVPAGRDTDAAADWIDQSDPSPGGPAPDLRPTEVPTAAPPPTLAPGLRLLVNEHLPAPRGVDWDGNGQADQADEWIELFNPGDAAVDIRGWHLDDVAGGGSDPYVFPDGTRIEARGHLLVFQRDSGIALNNGGDSVRLLTPDGSEMDAHDYSGSRPDASYARLADGELPWTDALPPSPGRTNGDGLPTQPAGSPSSTPTGPTATVPAPAATPSPSGPSATPDPGRILLPILISEVLFDAEQAGNDAAWEWVELHNRGPSAVSLAGWSIGDRSGWDALPEVSLPAGAFAVVAASDRAAGAIAEMQPEALTLVLADGRIGGGLANGGDVVRLRGPTGGLLDAVGYGNNLDAFDPAVPIGPPGSSIERIPPDRDRDRADDWWPQPFPSPGRAGGRPEGPPPIRLNEILPAPRRVDWDGDGQDGHQDEWVELYNPLPGAVDLGGWRVENRERDGWGYELPAGTRIEAGGFLLLHRAQTEVGLGNQADTLRLIRPDGVEADRFTWSRSPGYDRSWSRSEDGGGAWRSDFAVTPGGPNRPMPEEDEASAVDGAAASSGLDGPAELQPIAVLRALPAGRQVRVRGQVTAPPDLLASRSLYVGDAQAGILVYLAPRDARLPELALGDRVELVGQLKDYHGEREVVLSRPEDIVRLGSGRPLPPLRIPTGGVSEANEGRLVHVFGAVIGYGGPTITLDDGSGPARILAREATGIRRPWVEMGQQLGVTGIVGQYARSAPWQDGHRLMPRYETDFGDEPLPAGVARLDRAEAGRPAPRGRGWRPSSGLVTSPGSRAAVLCGLAL